MNQQHWSYWSVMYRDCRPAHRQCSSAQSANNFRVHDACQGHKSESMHYLLIGNPRSSFMHSDLRHEVMTSKSSFEVLQVDWVGLKCMYLYAVALTGVSCQISANLCTSAASNIKQDAPLPAHMYRDVVSSGRHAKLSMVICVLTSLCNGCCEQI